MELREYWRIIKRRKYIGAATALIIAAAYLFTLLQRPVTHQAKSSLMITQATLQERVLASISSVPSPTMALNTQVQLMKSKSVAREVAERVAKQTAAEFSPGQVQSQLHIQSDPQTSIIEITASASSAEMAVALARAAAEVAVEKNRSLSADEYDRAIAFLEEQAEAYKQRLQEAEERRKAFNDQYRTFEFSEDLSRQGDRIAFYREELERADLERRQINSVMENLQQQLRGLGGPRETVEDIPNPLLERYRERLFTLEMELSEARLRYTDAHPRVQEIQKRLQALREKMATEVPKFVSVPKQSEPVEKQLASQALIQRRLDLLSVGAKAEALKQLIGREEKSLKPLSRLQFRYSQLLREEKTAERLYHHVLDLFEQMRVSRVMRRGNARIVDIPASSEDAVMIPRYDATHIVLAVIVAILTGVFVCVVADLMDDTVRTSHKVKRYLHLPYLGGIPRSPDGAVLDQEASRTPIGESYHRICYGLETALSQKARKSVLVTSAKAEEGKTTLVANMGITLATQGEQTVLLDLDLRKPALHRVFRVSNTYGMTSLLQNERLDEKELVSAMQPTRYPSLMVIPSGPLVSNPIQLLRRPLLGQILDKLKEAAHFVLIDSPPLAPVVDASVIAPHVGGIILVVNAAQTRRREATLAKEVMSGINVPVLGVVLNFMVVLDDDYYYYYYYSGYGQTRQKKSRRSV